MHSLMRNLSIVLMLFGVHNLFAEDYAYHPANPMKLGWGFSILSPNQAIPPCLDLSGGTDGPSGGASPQLSASIVENHKDLYSLLNIDANLSARYMFGHANVNFSLEREVHFESDDTVWALRAFSDFGKRTLKKYELDEDAKKLTPTQFFNRCGFEYVAMERRAAEIVAVFTAHRLSDTLKQKISASLDGGFTIGGVWRRWRIGLVHPGCQRR